MNEHKGALPKAKIEKTRIRWFLWLVPIGAAGLCGWFVLRDVVLQGPAITVYFDNIEGLQEQNSFLQYRGTVVGQVTSLKLATDKTRVAVHIQLNLQGADLAREGSIFWIVRPELKLGSVSGLRTIVTGNYITIQPGAGARTNDFEGVDKHPIEHEGALEITLLSPQLSSLQRESPIFYRGVQVGEVLQCQLGKDAREVVIDAFIRTNYAPLVRVNSKFWNAGGVNVHLGLFSGLEIGAESAQTLVSGGIEFATPPDFNEAAAKGAVFALNEKAEEAWKKWDPAIEIPTPPPASPETHPKSGMFDLKSKQQ